MRNKEEGKFKKKELIKLKGESKKKLDWKSIREKEKK